LWHNLGCSKEEEITIRLKWVNETMEVKTVIKKGERIKFVENSRKNSSFQFYKRTSFLMEVASILNLLFLSFIFIFHSQCYLSLVSHAFFAFVFSIRNGKNQRHASLWWTHNEKFFSINFHNLFNITLMERNWQLCYGDDYMVKLPSFPLVLITNDDDE
jgi:hypothetical protein